MREARERQRANGNNATSQAEGWDDGRADHAQQRHEPTTRPRERSEAGGVADGHAEQREPCNNKARGDPRRTMRRRNSPKGNGLRGDITAKQQAPSQSRRQTPPVELASQWRVYTPHSGAEWKPYRIDKGEGQRACALGGVR